MKKVHWSNFGHRTALNSLRAQMPALGRFVDAQTQHHVSELWHVANWSGHHHHYELAPVSAELRRWLDEALVLVARRAQPVEPAQF